jgi:type I restriction enzyme S subunit
MPYLPMVEQRAIVGVLGVVDSAIELADKVIAKTERLKKGLMQQLLTKGIIHKEFKDTEIRKIPNKWQFVELKEVSEIRRGPFGGSIKKEIFVPKGFKIYEQQNVIQGDLSLGHYYIDEAKFMEMKSFAIREGDILLSAAGTIGKTAIVPKHFEAGIINQALIKITLDNNRIMVPFFSYLFNHEPYRRRVVGSSHGATMKNISSVRNLGSLKIPLPSIREQQEIISILSTVDRRLQLEGAERERLTKIKLGLMDLLLTGKVRIKVD